MSACSTTSFIHRSECWRLFRKKEPQNGWPRQQSTNEKSPAFGSQGRPIEILETRRQRGNRDHPARKTGRGADRFCVRRRLVRLPPGERPKFSRPDRPGEGESESRPRSSPRGHLALARLSLRIRATTLWLRMIRVVCLSDTHNRQGKFEVPNGDLLLHAGDLTGRGTEREVA